MVGTLGTKYVRQSARASGCLLVGVLRVERRRVGASPCTSARAGLRPGGTWGKNWGHMLTRGHVAPGQRPSRGADWHAGYVAAWRRAVAGVNPRVNFSPVASLAFWRGSNYPRQGNRWKDPIGGVGVVDQRRKLPPNSPSPRGRFHGASFRLSFIFSGDTGDKICPSKCQGFRLSFGQGFYMSKGAGLAPVLGCAGDPARPCGAGVAERAGGVGCDRPPQRVHRLHGPRGRARDLRHPVRPTRHGVPGRRLRGLRTFAYPPDTEDWCTCPHAWQW